MKFYRQKDRKYANIFLGGSRAKCYDFGCFAMSLCNAYEATEKQVMHVLTNKDFYTPEGLIYSGKVAEYFGGSYIGKSISISYDEEEFFGIVVYKTPFYDTHFCLINYNGLVNDPLSDEELIEKPSNYDFSHIRIFKRAVKKDNKSEIKEEVSSVWEKLKDNNDGLESSLLGIREMQEDLLNLRNSLDSTIRYNKEMQEDLHNINNKLRSIN